MDQTTSTKHKFNSSKSSSTSPSECSSSSLSSSSSSTSSITSGPLTEIEFDEYHSQHYQQIRSYFRTEAPFAYIIEQPAKCGVRFRYECEGRISTAIPGINASATRYTSPTIAVANYQGPVKVVVSCVSKNAPHRPHPHNLVGKKFCKDGISISIFLEPICEFGNLGILCAKRRDIRERLKLREQLKIDPYGTGFDHKYQAFKSIDLSVLRLCFQVYLFDNISGSFSHVLDPVLSDEIHDRKAINELSIIRLSHDSSPASGGGNAILLCEKVIKEDIQIRFFQEQCGLIVWQKLAEFSSSDIHKHFAICFRIPQYELPIEMNQRIIVQIQLYRPSDQATSESIPFYYYKDYDHSTFCKDNSQNYWNESFYNDMDLNYSHAHIDNNNINNSVLMLQPLIDDELPVELYSE